MKEEKEKAKSRRMSCPVRLGYYVRLKSLIDGS